MNETTEYYYQVNYRTSSTAKKISKDKKYYKG